MAIASASIATAITSACSRVVAMTGPAVIPGSVRRPARHGTTSLFAALDIATGRVGKCYGRHRAAEFRKFLDEIEAAVPRQLEVHLVLDNCATRPR